MKKELFLMLLAAACFALPACNTETGTVHETEEGYGAGQRDPGDVGSGGPTRSSGTSGSGYNDTGRVTSPSSGMTDTTGTSATMKTKKEVGTTKSKGAANTSKSETTKNVEVKKQ